MGAARSRAGADCLVIDAESEYEGKYVQAQTVHARCATGSARPSRSRWPGFPYVDYHPSFPYSVFLGPGGAQYNAPQMYWQAIGTRSTPSSPTRTSSTASTGGRSFHSDRSTTARRRARSSASASSRAAYGAANVSWWDWQEAPSGAWRSISQPVGSLTGFTPDTAGASVGKGALGDVVVWAQEHLVSAGVPVTIDGAFGPKTLAAVQAFQTAHGLPATGLIDSVTWQALLRYAPAHVTWVIRRKRLTASTAGAGQAVVPRSARLRARSYEIPRSLGSGRPRG